jgi:pimeloyl-ACP methyl ester carboxylesterase
MAAEPIATIPVDGGRIAYRRLGSGRPLIVLNGLAATSADWDPSFIDRLASANEIILLDNRGIGASNDDGAPFDIAKLAGDTVRVIEALELERASVLGWSMGGFIAQTLAFNDRARVHKLILLSTDPGGTATELASPPILGQLTDTSGTPHEQARRLLFLLFPSDLAESIYREFGDVVAAARAKLSPDLVGSTGRGDGRMAPRWRWRPTPRVKHANARRDGYRRHSDPGVQCAGTRQRHSRRMARPIQRRGPCFHGSISTLARGSHQ